MLFSQKSFSRFFTTHPRRRQAAYSVPAELELLPSKVLLSAIPVDAEPVEVDGEPVQEQAVNQGRGEQQRGGGTASLESITVTTQYSETTIAGAVTGWQGNYFDLSIEFGGVLTGESTNVASDFSFSHTVNSSITGPASITLKDSFGNVLDTYNFTL